MPKSINRKGENPVILELPSYEKMFSTFKEMISADSKDLSKSIGVICFNEKEIQDAESVILDLKLDKNHVIKLDSKKKISYIPTGVYLTSFENCKGLEFSKVYVLGLDLKSIKDFKDAKRAFVAVTRAMNEVVLLNYASKP